MHAYGSVTNCSPCWPASTANQRLGLVTLTFYLLTLKVVSESRVTWATSVPILVFLGFSVLDVGPMYSIDIRQTASSLNALARLRYGRGIIIWPITVPDFLTGYNNTALTKVSLTGQFHTLFDRILAIRQNVLLNFLFGIMFTEMFI